MLRDRAELSSKRKILLFPPDIYLIGAQKAGTTALADLLGRHPRITVSEPKEPNYFTSHYHKGLDWYRGCFQGLESNVLVDASTSYAAAPLGAGDQSPSNPLVGVPQRIHALNPKARFIYIVREPAARTYSAYWHNVRTGGEKLDFWAALEDDPSYLEMSDYAGQLRKYLGYFSLDAFVLITFEEFCRDPAMVATRCFAFMGLEPIQPSMLTSASQKNRSYTYNRFGRIITSFLQEGTALKRASRGAKWALPSVLYKFIGRALTNDIPKLADRDRNVLQQYFRQRNQEFRQLTGIHTDY